MRFVPSRFAASVAIGLCLLLSFEPILLEAAPAGRIKRPPADPPIVVNRKVPRVDPPPSEISFPAWPTDDEIARSRVLPGPMIPLRVRSGIGIRFEDRALAQALLQYARSRDPENVAPLTRFLADHHGSRYEAALLTNLGVLYKQQGRVSRAFSSLASAWELTRNGTDRESLAIANWALGEAAEMHAHLDPATRGKLDVILDSLGSRDLHGPTTERVRLAIAGRQMRELHPEEAFRCGPVSVAMLRAFLGMPRDLSIEHAPGSRQGFSLAGLEQLANSHGMQMRAIYRRTGSPIPVPAVIHWRYDHYSAILERKEVAGREYFRVQNPLLDHDRWMSREAIEEEASGFYLVFAHEFDSGWRPASDAEASGVWGRCEFEVPALDQLMDWALKALCGNGTPGMPQYNFDLAAASLTVSDTPLGYTPPLGPPVQFRITYHQRESWQPSIFNYANLGPKWTFSWFSYVGGSSTISSNLPYLGGNISGRVFLRDGGVEQYTNVKTVSIPGLLTTDYGYQYQSHAHLLMQTPLQTTGGTRPSPPYYERQLPDGSKELFEQAVTSQNQYFLTRIVDAQGNAIKFTYDSKMRIMAVTDAIGQVTTLSYDKTDDPLKITKVTDPFGRSTTLTYDFNGHLSGITDVAGMTSTFTYGQNDFITTMTTPYGETVFQTGHGSADTTADPSYLIHAAKYPTAAQDPMNVYVQATDPNGDTERVEFCNFVSVLPQHDSWNDSLNTGGTLPIPYLNTRLSFYWDKSAWKQYPGDYTKAKAYRWLDGVLLGTQSGILDYRKDPLAGRVVFHYPNQTKPYYQIGSSAVPSAILRLLEDGQTQQASSIEQNAAGRITKYTDPSGRQFTFLYDVDQTDLLEARNAATNELLAKFSYSKPHQIATSTNASGGVTTYSYNAAGEVVSITDPKQQTTRFTYDAHGYLLTVTGPLPAAITRFTYDTFGRMQTAADSEGYTVTYTYDALDRVTKIAYPDKTTEQIAYDKLDPVTFTDRLGRVTTTVYDALRHPVSVTDPLGRTTTFAWCSCGALVSMTDPAGNTTTWNRDVQNRVTSKVLADGSTTQYTYDPTTGRLAQIVDANGQVSSFSYFPDGALQEISYSNATNTTYPVLFTYDPNYSRLATFTDAAGTTTMSYGRAGTPGGLQLVNVTGPRGEAVAYSYDTLGRVAGRSIDGAAVSYTYDPLNRLVNVTSPLGSFALDYVGATNRLQTVTYPSGQSSRYTYFDNLGDQRLKQILNQLPDKSTLSQLAYSYRATGEIQTMTTGQGTYAFTYDAASQLTGVALAGGNTFAYAYDLAGNRLTEQVGAQSTSAIFSTTNELSQLDVQPFTYDANGNLLSDGARTFEWDAENRLTALNTGTHRSEFTYDGLARRTRIVEKESGDVVGDKQLIWCGGSVCEDRDAVTGVRRRFFAQGETQISGGTETPYFYTRDQLGSVREVTDSSGSVVSSYDYDPWGRQIQLSGGINAAFGYAGYYLHAPSGLYLTQTRAYDPNLGRWLRRDPAGEQAGTNLYSYAGNSPNNAADPTGLLTLFGRVVNAGEDAGQSALDYYAGVTVDPGANRCQKLAAYIGGFFAALWTPSTSNATLNVLAAALAGRTLAGGGAGAAGSAGSAVTGAAGTGVATTTTAEGGFSLAQAVEQGVVNQGGKLYGVLNEIEKVFQAAPPKSALDALAAIQKATNAVGLEPGVVTGTADGGFILKNVGNIITTVSPSGEIAIMRGADVLLRLVP